MISTIKFKVTFANGRTIENAADLGAGSTLITGKNGRGKSLFLEMAGFALWGSDALRGLASDYKSLNVDLTVAIRGVTYEIHRTKTNADVTLNGEKIAAGTKPVNEWVARALGYGFSVYRVAHWCAQGDIAALANMKPAERKKMIDDVAGLTQLDSLFGFISEQVKLHKATIHSMRATMVAPIEPAAPSIPVLAELTKEGEYLNSLTTVVSQLRLSAQIPVKPVAPLAPLAPVAAPMPVKPEPLGYAPKPEPQGVEAPVLEDILQPEGWVEGALVNLKVLAAQMRMQEEAVDQHEYRHTLLTAQLAAQPDLETLKQLWANRATATQLTTEAERLKKAGLSQCPACGHEHEVHAHRLEEIAAELAAMPEDPGLELMTVADYQSTTAKLQELATQLEAGREAQQKLPQLQETITLWGEYERLLAERNRIVTGYNMQCAQVEAYNRNSLAQWKANCASVDQQNAQQLQQWERQCQAVQAQNQAQAEHYELQLAAFESQKCAHQAAMADYEGKRADAEKAAVELAAIEAQYPAGVQAYLSQRHRELDSLKGQWVAYDTLMGRYRQDVASYAQVQKDIDSIQAQIDDLEKARQALNNVKLRVQSYLIPSLSRVSSYLVSQMTGGELSLVSIDDSFEVFVDGQPLRTLSGSGKDVVNLALRIGLGRVLTHSVLPMMMLDEIDAAMDQDRATYTWECIQRVTPQIGQVLQVSHKSLQAQHTVVV